MYFVPRFFWLPGKMLTGISDALARRFLGFWEIMGSAWSSWGETSGDYRGGRGFRISPTCEEKRGT